MNPQWQRYRSILNTVVKPALGCTEPICVAYASAVARVLLKQQPESISIGVSDNLYKNSMGVFVPGTGKVGLAIASAVGAIGGDPDAGLEVLASITTDHVKLAQKMIDEGKISIKRDKCDEFIYCCVEAKSGKNRVTVEISGGHTQIIKKIVNDEVIFSKSLTKSSSTTDLFDGVKISIEDIYTYATRAEFEDINFILAASDLNSKLSTEGLEHEYGLQVGRSIEKSIDSGFTSADLANKIMMHTAAASDARMGGAMLPAMTNYGSGNQGIAATVPVVITAKHFSVSDEKLARALIMSHLGAIYIKSHYPPLSAFCGNTVTSSAAAMAMVYLAGGTYQQSCLAIQNVLSDCSGMVCDGAKSSCAMKVKTSTSSAINAFILAIQCRGANQQGIVAENVEDTIRNVGQLVTQGMGPTDTTIINIMSS